MKSYSFQYATGDTLHTYNCRTDADTKRMLRHLRKYEPDKTVVWIDEGDFPPRRVATFCTPEEEAALKVQWVAHAKQVQAEVKAQWRRAREQRK
jgi:hypothetical protein